MSLMTRVLVVQNTTGPFVGSLAAAKKPEALIRHWHELVVYISQPRRHLPIIPILFGRGDNGRTKLMHTVMQLLGPALEER